MRCSAVGQELKLAEVNGLARGPGCSPFRLSQAAEHDEVVGVLQQVVQGEACAKHALTLLQGDRGSISLRAAQQAAAAGVAAQAVRRGRRV